MPARDRWIWTAAVVSAVGVVVGSALAAPAQGDWGKNAVKFRGKIGLHVTFKCPARSPIPLKVFPVWGDGVYTDNSVVCIAAVHAGQITYAGGGEVTIEIRPGYPSYDGRTSHGIKSADHGPWPGSYYFVETEGTETADYRNAASDVCNDTRSRIAALGSPKTKEQLRGYILNASVIVQNFNTRIANLYRPAALHDLHQQVVRIIQRETALFTSMAGDVYVGADPVAAFNKISDDLERLGNQEDALWLKLGVTGCLGD